MIGLNWRRQVCYEVQLGPRSFTRIGSKMEVTFWASFQPRLSRVAKESLREELSRIGLTALAEYENTYEHG